MRAIVINRLIQTVVTVLIVSFIAFMLVQLIPGDPVATILGMEATVEEVENLRRELGLDQPLLVQYVNWLAKLVQVDFGFSYIQHEKVIDLIARSGPKSLLLSSLAILLGLLVGVPAGIISAVKRGRKIDSLVTLLSNLGVAVPKFWLGIVSLYLFGLYLGWLPVMGYTSPLDDFWDSIRKMIMPVCCMSVHCVAYLARQTRASMLEVIHQDYMRTARSKGLRGRVIIIRHGLRTR